MKLLIANAGSSSLKCQLLDMPAEDVLAEFKVERVGNEHAPVQWSERGGQTRQASINVPDYVSAIRFVLDRLLDSETGALESLSDLDGVGFKPVYAKNISGCRYMDDCVLNAMQEYSSILAPLHNPIYIRAVKDFRTLLPDTPMIGLFEDAFFDRMPDYATVYPIPWDWTQKYNIRKHGFHGASHRYVSDRIADLTGRKREELNVIACHLGGSSSLAAVKGGTAIDCSFGFSTQTGLPQSARSSDMDPFIIPFLVTRGEGTVEYIAERMMKEAGISAISGVGFDMRDLEKAVADGNQRARLAIDTYAYHIKKYLGGYMAVLGHTDVVTVAGGTGERSPHIRSLAFSGLEELGIVLDEEKNKSCVGSECRISADDSRIELWVVPTNEELVVARECYKLLSKTS